MGATRRTVRVRCPLFRLKLIACLAAGSLWVAGADASIRLKYKGDANGGFVDNHIYFDSHGDAYLGTGGAVDFLYNQTDSILWTNAASSHCLASAGGWVKRYTGGDCDTNDDSGNRRWQFLSDGRLSTSSGQCLTQYSPGNSRLFARSCSTVSDVWYVQCSVAGLVYSSAKGCMAPLQCQAGELPDYSVGSCQPCPAGGYLEPNASSCAPCPAGKYLTASGADSCPEHSSPDVPACGRHVLGG